MILPCKGKQIAEEPVVVGRTRPKPLVHKFSQPGDLVRTAREQGFPVGVPQRATHDGTGQFKCPGTRGC
ncbi:hypothetical protein GCM10010261_19460 [Streptomyces pilosus]|nr:hypothetical protein GCM10010261_19460 [Streptomyces pilosus]